MNQPQALVCLAILIKLSSQQDRDDSASEISHETEDLYHINLNNIEDDYDGLNSEELQILSETNQKDSSYSIDQEYKNVEKPAKTRIFLTNTVGSSMRTEEKPKAIVHHSVLIMNGADGLPLHNKSYWQPSFDGQPSTDNTTEKLFHPYRYTVVILRKGSVFANGALISDKLVLTAAGPFFNIGETMRLYRVRLGSLDYKRGGTLLPIKTVEIHPSYVKGKPDFDVALLLMPVPVEFSKTIEPTVLSNSFKSLHNKFFTSYWPRLIIDGRVISPFAQERVKYNRMRVSLQSMLNWETCYEELKKEGTYLHESSLCLKPPVTHHSNCMPDVGAPIVAEDGLWGVTSGWISANCSQSPSPAIFTRITTPVVNYWLELRMLTQNLQ